ncbi:MAG: TetR/AcrR family transcriptional regulator [Bacteroidota bacterium]
MARPKAFKESDILEKAMMVFWKKGYHATSIQDLVSYLGINRASMYDTFGNKEALFHMAFKHYRETNKARIHELLSSYASVKEGFTAMLVGAMKATLSDEDRKGCFSVNCTTELLPGDDFDLLPTLAENRKEFVAFFGKYIQVGIDKGELSAFLDVETTASYIHTLYSGLQVNAKITDDLEELINIIHAGLSILDKD